MSTEVLSIVRKMRNKKTRKVQEKRYNVKNEYPEYEKDLSDRQNEIYAERLVGRRMLKELDANGYVDNEQMIDKYSGENKKDNENNDILINEIESYKTKLGLGRGVKDSLNRIASGTQPGTSNENKNEDNDKSIYEDISEDEDF